MDPQTCQRTKRGSLVETSGQVISAISPGSLPTTWMVYEPIFKNVYFFFGNGKLPGYRIEGRMHAQLRRWCGGRGDGKWVGYCSGNDIGWWIDNGVMKTEQKNTYQEKDKVNEIYRSRRQRSPTRSLSVHLVNVCHGMWWIDSTKKSVTNYFILVINRPLLLWSLTFF